MILSNRECWLPRRGALLPLFSLENNLFFLDATNYFGSGCNVAPAGREQSSHPLRRVRDGKSLASEG